MRSPADWAVDQNSPKYWNVNRLRWCTSCAPPLNRIFLSPSPYSLGKPVFNLPLPHAKEHRLRMCGTTVARGVNMDNPVKVQITLGRGGHSSVTSEIWFVPFGYDHLVVRLDPLPYFLPPIRRKTRARTRRRHQRWQWSSRFTWAPTSSGSKNVRAWAGSR